MGKLYIFDWRWELKSSPDELWAYVSDTHRLNIVTGMPKIIFSEAPQPDGGVKRFAHAPIRSWLSLNWEEVPFDWVKPRRHSVRRIFSTRLFPIKSLQNVFNLYPGQNGGTELQFELTLEENGIIGKLLIPGIAKTTHQSFENAFRQIDAYIQSGAERPFDTPIVKIEGSGQARLQALLGELHQEGYSAALLKQFEAHIQHAAVEELTRMRPYVYANAWQTNHRETLSLFLQAASIGLLDLSWDILCPECRGAKHKTTRLLDLPETVHCPSCNIDYNAHFDQSVEATFSLNPEIAAVHRTDYCIGGPHATPHVLIQQMLHPGETRRAIFPLQAGHYRLRAPQVGNTDGVFAPVAVLTPLPGQPWLTAAPEHSNTSAAVHIYADRVELVPDHVQPTDVEMTLINHTNSPQMLMLEDGSWSKQIATAADVTALQVFRDLFSSDALRPGYTVGIQNMVVLFTDLKDSTALYQTVGDASAFGTVIDHFDILRGVITQRGGGVVKTIGDAVMAVFRDPADGFLATLEMIERIQAYNQANPGYELHLKFGLHQGACIAVTLNERLDYFGSTVNVAARLEGQSKGDDIVTSDKIIDHPAVQLILAERALLVEPFDAQLKGIAGYHKLYRIQPNATPQKAVNDNTDMYWVDVG